MKQKSLISQLAKIHNGTITHRELALNGVSSYSISKAVQDGTLEKIRPGIYLFGDDTEDIFYSLQQKYKKGIYSLETALYLWGLSDQYPFSLDMTFPRGYNNPTLDIEINPHIQTKSLATQGITQTESFNGNVINLYTPERTLAEILRPINAVDIEIITNAFKMWNKEKKKDINTLMSFAEKFRVTRNVNSYLEVLL